jgi:flagellin-like hook-associated protein FlgL
MAINDISLTSGMRSNLLNLQSTSNLLDRTQTRLSTGKKVNSALDDPIAYFTAKSHTNRASDLSAKKDSMSEAIQVIKSADKGIEGMTGLLSQAKSLATSAATSSDKKALAEQFNEVLKQIGEMAKDSGYGGVNLVQGATPPEVTDYQDYEGTSLGPGSPTYDVTVEAATVANDDGDGTYSNPFDATDTTEYAATDYFAPDGTYDASYDATTFFDPATMETADTDGNAYGTGDTETHDSIAIREGFNEAELTVEFNETGSSKLDLQGFDIAVDATTGNLTLTTSNGSVANADGAEAGAPTISAIDTTASEIDFGDAISEIDAAIDALRSESSTLSSNLSVITTRQDFTTNMINTLTEGADTLTAADMNEEGANMLMLQTRQQLSTRSLALSAQSAQAVLGLF